MKLHDAGLIAGQLLEQMRPHCLQIHAAGDGLPDFAPRATI